MPLWKARIKQQRKLFKDKEAFDEIVQEVKEELGEEEDMSEIAKRVGKRAHEELEVLDDIKAEEEFSGEPVVE